MTDYFVYGLVDPTDGSLRYVGISRTPKARLHQHKSWARNPKSRMCTSEWIASLLARSLEPEIRILERYVTDSRSTALDIEAQWIDHYLKEGAPLVNRRRPKYVRRKSKILPGREPTLHLDLTRGWYYTYDE